ncbi:MAG: hypothetical protein ACK5LS_05035 [Propioniciclava sp.]
MSTLILHAVGIDEIRELFSGADTTAASLRSWAAEAFPAPEPPPRTGLLDRLGPLTRRSPRAPVVRAGVPTGRDLEDVLHGRDVPLERLDAAWALVDVWLTRVAWSTTHLTVGRAGLDAIDFAATLAGVPADDGIRRILNHQLALPLKDLPGQTSGYVRGAHALAMARAWENALPTMDAPDPAFATDVSDWLARFSVWTAQAEEDGRPSPDLVAFHRAGATRPTITR